MLYSTRKQTEHFEEALVEPGVLGLLEIEGQKLLRESAELQEETGDRPAEKTLDAVKRGLWKQKQKNRIARAAGVIRPVFVRAAVVFFAVFLGAGSMLITSAEAREYVYQLVFTVHDRYSEVVNSKASNNETFKSYFGYGVNYIPDGYQCTFKTSNDLGVIYVYSDSEDNSFSVTISQLNGSGNQTVRFDTENSDSIQPIAVNNSLGLMIEEDGCTQIVWQNSQTFFSVISQLPSETVIKIAEGIV